MLNLLLETVIGNSNTGGNQDWIMWALIGGVVGLFVVMIFLQRRRQRTMVDAQMAMLDRLRMGMRVKLVSGVVGVEYRLCQLYRDPRADRARQGGWGRFRAVCRGPAKPGFGGCGGGGLPDRPGSTHERAQAC